MNEETLMGPLTDSPLIGQGDDRPVLSLETPLKNPGGRLGEILLEEGLVRPEELVLALEKREREGGFLGKALIKLDILDEDTLCSLLVRQCRIPFVNVSDYAISRDLAKLIPHEICKKFQLMPLDRMAKILTVAMVNPLDEEALDAVREVCPEHSVKPVLCGLSQFEEALRWLYTGDGVFPKRRLRSAGQPRHYTFSESRYGLPVELNPVFLHAEAEEPRATGLLSSFRRNALLAAAAACCVVIALFYASVENPSAAANAEASVTETRAPASSGDWTGRLSPSNRALLVIEKYETRLAERPDSTDAPALVFAIANLYQRKVRDYEQASEHYMALLAEYPDWEGRRLVFMQLAHCFEMLGDVEGQQWMYHSMLELFPDDAVAYR